MHNQALDRTANNVCPVGYVSRAAGQLERYAERPSHLLGRFVTRPEEGPVSGMS